MKNKLEKIRKKISGNQGFSLGELLAATVILLLASQVMAQGIAFGVRMYNQTLTRSHGKQLCSTLTAAIETELRYTTSITTDNNGRLLTYFSPTYGLTQSGFLSIDQEDKTVINGEIAIKVTDENKKVICQRLVSSASYSSFDLKAKVKDVIYNKTDHTFHVVLSITDRKERELVQNTFDVIPVNNIKEGD